MDDELNTLSDEDTRAEFMRLRETTLREIRVPGVDAARHTVGRRRLVHATAAAAGLAVVTIAGGAAIALAPAGHQPIPMPAAAPSGAVGSTGNPLPTHGSLVAIAREAPQPDFWFELTPAKPEIYRFEVVCSGSGSGTVTLTAGNDTASAPVTCGVPPVHSPVALTVTENSESLRVGIEWEPGTDLQDTPGGWAIQVIRNDSDNKDDS